MFIGTLKFFAALAVVICILLAAGEVLTYRPEPSHEEIVKRETVQTAYVKQQEAEEAQARAEEAQHKAEEIAQWHKEHDFVLYSAYVVGQWNQECCTLYTEAVNQGLVVGTVRNGEQVQVLSNVLYDSVRVKTRRGLIGWIHPAKRLSLSK